MSGRAYPDISAQATQFCVTPFGCGVAGTSCATPTASGVIALLNDLRLASGKPTLGFLNPFVYENADAFNDITKGHSGAPSSCRAPQTLSGLAAHRATALARLVLLAEGCELSGGGWPAAKGWDAVTGVGTPNYKKLAAAVAKLR